MGLDIRQCKWCRRPYQRTNSDYCAVCDDIFNDAFVKIRDFLDESPNANIQAVSEGTGIEERMILQLLKDERLSFTNGTPLACEQCGAQIATGRYCQDCQKVMKQNVSQMLSGYQKKDDHESAQSMSTPDFHNKIRK